MEVGLPRETQQIDRVIEAFAGRYLECNPMLFTSEGERLLAPASALLFNSYQDHPYVLAFSLIMLHTDAFNKSNKRKMTKADYIKNTRLPGVGTEVLDVSRPQRTIPQLICILTSAFTIILSLLHSSLSRILLMSMANVG